MKNLSDIKTDVYDVGGRHPEIDLALTTLRVALRAYFSTYASFAGRFFLFEKPGEYTSEQVDWHTNLRYSECAAEAILHFQHFAELVCKHFLRRDHGLLADVALTKPVTLHKLLHGKKLGADEGNLRSIEFSEALERFCKLVDANALKDASSLQWIKSHEASLKVLNEFRNRVWHRGKYVLRYASLDAFVGGYVLPFVLEVVKNKEYSGNEYRWLYSRPACGIDLLAEIVAEVSGKPVPDLKKIAFLKEVGRAAYNVPLMSAKPLKKKLYNFTELFDLQTRNRAQAKAEAVASLEHQRVVRCHVCGVDSLVVFTEIEDNFDDETAATRERWEWTHKVECECCGFSATPEIGDPSNYGYSDIADLWTTKPLN